MIALSTNRVLPSHLDGALAGLCLSLVVALQVGCVSREDGATDVAAQEADAQCIDTDADTICDEHEITQGTDPSDPDSDDDGLDDGEEQDLGTDPNNPDTDGDGLDDATEILLGTDPNNPDAACSNQESAAEVALKPTDIIFIIDNSASMRHVVERVENNINANFASIIGNSGADYRIVMLSRHGAFSSDDSVCIASPLSGHDCSPVPAEPTDTALFHHHSIEIGSTDSLELILDSYNTADEFGHAPNGWQEWLRPDSHKVFVELTDALTTMQPADFEAALYNLQPAYFGDAQNPNYVFHSFLGFQPKANPAEPFLPGEPIETSRCQHPVFPSITMFSGTRYQEISMNSGGLRFSICAFDDYDVVFNEIASGVVDSISLPCSYTIPEDTEEGELDLERMAVIYRPGNGDAAQKLNRVDNAGACTANSYYLDDESPANVVLCDSTCSVVEQDTAGTMNIHTGCKTMID